MLNNVQKQVSPFTRKADTLQKCAAVAGGSLIHYLSRSTFETTILQYGPLAEQINEVMRRTDITELPSMKIYMSQVHRLFTESLLSLYCVEIPQQNTDQNAYLYKYLRGKFFDVSELETMIQLVPVAVDPDIVRDVQRLHPAAAFKVKIGDSKQVDIVYDATDDYYIKYQRQVEIT